MRLVRHTKATNANRTRRLDAGRCRRRGFGQVFTKQVATKQLASVVERLNEVKENFLAHNERLDARTRENEVIVIAIGVGEHDVLRGGRIAEHHVAGSRNDSERNIVNARQRSELHLASPIARIGQSIQIIVESLQFAESIERPGRFDRGVAATHNGAFIAVC